MTFRCDPFWTLHDEILRQLWAEGITTSEIGRRIGKSKNAVIGRAHRLQLTPRPSPIRGTAPGDVKRRSRVRKPTPPVLDVVALIVEEALPVPAVSDLTAEDIEVLEPVGPPVAPAPTAAPVAAPQPVPVQHGRCRWPMWGNHERAGRPQRFCTTARLPGVPYCSAHCSVAYRGAWAMAEDVEEAA